MESAKPYVDLIREELGSTGNREAIEAFQKLVDSAVTQWHELNTIKKEHADLLAALKDLIPETDVETLHIDGCILPGYHDGDCIV